MNLGRINFLPVMKAINLRNTEKLYLLIINNITREKILGEIKVITQWF
jgi:hypothetical protein